MARNPKTTPKAKADETGTIPTRLFAAAREVQHDGDVYRLGDTVALTPDQHRALAAAAAVLPLIWEDGAEDAAQQTEDKGGAQ